MMRVLKIIGDIDIKLELPEDAEIVDVKINDYLVTEYDEKFDIILCVHALQTLWVGQTTQAIEKLVDDLADRGELHVHVPATEQALKSMLRQQQDPMVFYMIWGTKDRPFHSGFTLLWLRALIEQTGASIRRAEMGVFKMQQGEKEVRGVEHVVIATVDRS